MVRLLPCPILAAVDCVRTGHGSQALAGKWASRPGTIGMVWLYGQVTVPYRGRVIHVLDRSLYEVAEYEVADAVSEVLYRTSTQVRETTERK